MTGTLTSELQRERQPWYADPRFPRLAVLRGVSLESIEVRIESCVRRHFAPGEVLLRPGEENGFLYAILTGSVAVHVTDPAAAGPLTTLGPGACVGEMSLIENLDPSAWVVACEPTEALAIEHDTVWELINGSHQFARNLLMLLSQRLRADNHYISARSGILRHYDRGAMTDALTELFNRQWMEEMFRRKLRRCDRDRDQVALVVVDVDLMRAYNDIHGHVAGDHALCAVADALREHFRPTDMIARYGGDEFAVLLPGTSAADARAIAERVREAVGGNPGERTGHADGGGITVSVGLAERRAGDTLEDLLERADEALRRAKLCGRNCIAG